MFNVLSNANRLLKFLMVISIGLMAILVFLNVVLRYGFNSNLMITEELGRYLFVWLTFLGIISAFIRNTHIRVDSLYRRMPNALRYTVSLLSDVAMLVCCVLLLLGCWELSQQNMRNLLPISELPVGVLYFAALPCSLVVSLMLVARIVRKLSGHFEGEKA